MEASARVDVVWQQYNSGDLEGHTRSLVDLFVAMWVWDADRSGICLSSVPLGPCVLIIILEFELFTLSFNNARAHAASP